MPDLPVISGRDAARIFGRNGWTVSRQRGSHMVLSEPSRGANLSMPDHREPDRGTLRALIRSADLTVKAFEALRRER